MDSASSASRCESSYVKGFTRCYLLLREFISNACAPCGSQVDAALGLVLSCPAAIAAFARLGAGGAPNRCITAVVERVVWEVVAVDVVPQVPLGPVRERVDLPDPALGVLLQLWRRSPGGRLLAADPSDPGVNVGQRVRE